MPHGHANGSRQPFVLGAWDVHPDRLRLEHGDRVVDLQPRAMDLLVYLVERRPDVVSSSELVERVWAPSVVGDENVKVAISKLRAALGDDPLSAAVPRR